MVRAVMGAVGAADEASLARPPLTSCCAARFLTGQGPVSICGPGVGDPWSKGANENRRKIFVPLLD